MRFKNGVGPDLLDLGLLDMLQQAEKYAGRGDFIITSAKVAEGEKNFHGPHGLGLAVDIRCRSSSDRWIMHEALKRVGFKRIGLYDKHIHVDRGVHAPAYLLWIGVSS